MSDSKPLLALTSPAGPDLVPTRLRATEAISEPFTVEVDAVSPDPVATDTMLEKNATIALRVGVGEERHFHGIVTEFGPLGRGGPRGHAYRLVMRPRLLSAAYSEDCQLFFRKTAQDIVKAVLADCGVTNLKFKLFGTPKPRDMTVQYNETALRFVTRLMEEEGWYYYFDHGADDHAMVVTDGNGGFQAVPGGPLHFGPYGTTGAGPEMLTEWYAPGAVTQGTISLSDYDPNTPDKKLQSKTPTVLRHPGTANRPVFHWPARTDQTGQVQARVKLRMEAAEAQVSLSQAAGAYAALFAGGRFNLEEEGGAKPHVVQRIEHLAERTSLHAGGAREHYSNRFSAFPNTVPWRQPSVTPPPRMEGLHSAVVLGPQGEEIHKDKQGRVKIRFHWDWRETATADNSPFVRVIQPWAGNGWGAQFIPRIGTEVAISFMDADPDRPVVVGGFYNGADKPIFSEAEKTKTGFRTRSSLKGGTADFNEFSFDDEKGKEVVLMHAQKDLKTEVENDQALIVHANRTVTVDGKETLTVTGDRTHEVTKGNDALTVKQGNYEVGIDKGNHATLVGLGNHALQIKTGNQSVLLNTGNQETETKLGNVSIKASLGKISMEAMQSISLKVGTSTLTLSQTGIELKGMSISIHGTMSAELKGLMVTTKADGMLTLKGSITMIN